jgi:mRNA-degrading endonuclease YafQ of YafQ-DinJ toxin-antitoxin module
VEVSFSSAFKRPFKKRIQGNTDLEEKFWQKLELFTIYPYNPILKTHKLSGKLKEFWSFSVGSSPGLSYDNIQSISF